MFDAVRAVARGHVILGPGAAEGLDNRSIGRRLDLSAKTVANHVSNILTKLQIATRAQAIVTARRAGLIADVATTIEVPDIADGSDAS